MLVRKFRAWEACRSASKQDRSDRAAWLCASAILLAVSPVATSPARAQTPAGPEDAADPDDTEAVTMPTVKLALPPEEKIADPDVSLLVILSSQYRAKGLSQTQNRPAVLMVLDVASSSGFYVGGFIANVKLAGIDTRAEINYQAGYRFKRGRFSADTRALFVDYPDYGKLPNGRRINYFEVRSVVRYDAKPAALALSYWFSPNFVGESGKSHYVEGSAAYTTESDFTVSALAGRNWIEKPERFGFPTWWNWSLTVSHPLPAKLVGSVGVIGTDIARRECGGGQNICSTRLFGSVSHRF